MRLRPEEITSILKERIEQYDVETDLAEVGGVLQVGDGIARIHGLENAVALELLELEHGVTGIASQPRGGQRRRGALRRVGARQGRRAGQRTGQVASVPVGDALIGRIVDPLGNPLDGGPPIETTETRPLEFKAPGVVDRQPVKRAADDRHQGDRRDDHRRPRPAGADHRRPLDRQDGDPDRHDPEPEGQRRDLHLRRDRSEGVDGRPGLRAAPRRRRDGLHDHRQRVSERVRPDQVDGALRRRGDGRALHVQRRPRPRACTTTCPSTRTRTGRCRCSSVGRPDARRIPATSSTSTRGCSSGP